MTTSISHWGLFNQDVDNAVGGYDDGEGITEEMWATARPAREVFAELGMDVGNPIVAKAYPLDDEADKMREAFEAWCKENGHILAPLYGWQIWKAATAAAEARYLPVIERLVKSLETIKTQHLSAMVMQGIAEQALAAPLLKGGE